MRLWSVLRVAATFTGLAALVLCATETSLRAQSVAPPSQPNNGHSTEPSASREFDNEFYVAAGAFSLPEMKRLLQKGANVNAKAHCLTIHRTTA